VGRAALRARLPMWVKVAALAGLVSSVVSLAIAVYPIVDVTSRMEYAAKICAVVLVANGLGARSITEKRITLPAMKAPDKSLSTPIRLT
jgi:hypothetical protein